MAQNISTVYYQYLDNIRDCGECWDYQTRYDIDACFRTTDDYGYYVYAKASWVNPNVTVSISFYQDSGCTTQTDGPWSYDLEQCSAYPGVRDAGELVTVNGSMYSCTGGGSAASVTWIWWSIGVILVIGVSCWCFNRRSSGSYRRQPSYQPVAPRTTVVVAPPQQSQPVYASNQPPMYQQPQQQYAAPQSSYNYNNNPAPPTYQVGL
jgi:hypothetical protein